MSQLFNHYIINKLENNGYRYNTDHIIEDFYKYNTSQVYHSEECLCTTNQCDCQIKPTNTIQLKSDSAFSGKVHLTYRSPYNDDTMVDSKRTLDGFQLRFTITTNSGVWTIDLTTGSYETHPNITVINNIVSLTFEVEDNTKIFLTMQYCSRRICSDDIIRSRFIFKRDETKTARNRTRRSFLGLQNGRDVERRIAHAVRLSNAELSNSMMHQLVPNMRQTDKAVAQNNQELRKLYLDLCEVDNLSQGRISSIELNLSLQRTADRVINSLRQCTFGRLPDEISYKTIVKFCMGNFNEAFCNRMGHQVRTLMGCKI